MLHEWFITGSSNLVFSILCSCFVRVGQYILVESFTYVLKINYLCQACLDKYPELFTEGAIFCKFKSAFQKIFADERDPKRCLSTFIIIKQDSNDRACVFGRLLSQFGSEGNRHIVRHYMGP